MSKITWTRAMIITISECYEEGLSLYQIADGFGVSQHAVRGAIETFGVATEEARRKRLPGLVRRLFNKRNDRQIAAELGVPVAEVTQEIARQGLTRSMDRQHKAKPAPRPDGRKAHIRWAYDNRHSDPEAALAWRLMAESVRARA